MAALDTVLLRKRASSSRLASWVTLVAAVACLGSGALGFWYVGLLVRADRQDVLSEVGNATRLANVRLQFDAVSHQCESLSRERMEASTKLNRRRISRIAGEPTATTAYVTEVASEIADTTERPLIQRLSKLQADLEKYAAQWQTAPARSPAEREAEKLRDDTSRALGELSQDERVTALLERAKQQSAQRLTVAESQLQNLEQRLAVCAKKRDALVEKVTDLEVAVGPSASVAVPDSAPPSSSAPQGDPQSQRLSISFDASVALPTDTDAKTSGAVPPAEPREKGKATGAASDSAPPSSFKELTDRAFNELIILRIGIMIFAFALVRILLSLHNEARNLGAYYDARADAIELLRESAGAGDGTFGNLDTLESRVAILNVMLPPQLDTSAPNVPSERMFSTLFEAAIKRVLPSSQQRSGTKPKSEPPKRNEPA